MGKDMTGRGCSSAALLWPNSLQVEVLNLEESTSMPHTSTSTSGEQMPRPCRRRCRAPMIWEGAGGGGGRVLTSGIICTVKLCHIVTVVF